MVRRLVCIALPLVLLIGVGCTPLPSDDDDASDDDDDDATDDDDAGPSDEPAPLATLSNDDCPDLALPGTKSFASGGLTRDVIIQFPEDRPEGMPVIFMWHGLGDTAANMAGWMRTEQFAQDNDAIVVVPSSTGNFFIEWDYSGDGAEDLALFDDLRTCLVNELGADITRFSSTGFSAGGVWTSALSMHRSTSLATILPFSGGLVTGLTYDTPEYTFPALLASGGAGVDTWGAGALLQDFAVASDDFATELRDDGHVVVRCNHGGGHQLSSHALQMLEEWMLPHRFGYPSPFDGGALGGLPSDECSGDQ